MQIRCTRNLCILVKITGGASTQITKSLIPIATFCEHGRMLKHEAARDQGDLVVLDRAEDLAQSEEDGLRVVFISHQWLSQQEPDPGNVHYEVVVRAIKRVCDANKVRWEDVLVWIDYMSIPQHSPALQKLSIWARPCA